MSFEVSDEVILLLQIALVVLAQFVCRKQGQNTTLPQVQNIGNSPPKDGRVLDTLGVREFAEKVLDEVQRTGIGRNRLELRNAKDNYIPQLVRSLIAIGQKRISNEAFLRQIRLLLSKQDTEISKDLLKEEDR